MYRLEGRPLSGGDCVLTSDRFMVIGIRAVLLHQNDGARDDARPERIRA